MRFITKIELEADRSPEWHIEHSQRRMGEMLQESFGLWETNFISRNGAAAIKRSLEIEAFPMDKWVEFKQKLLEHFCVYPGSTQKMLDFIKEVESFGKPSGDGITNPQII